MVRRSRYTVRRGPVREGYHHGLGPDGALVALTGRMVAVEPRTTRQGRSWLFGVLSARNGLVDVMVFPAVFDTIDGPLLVDTAVQVTGRVDRREPGALRVMALAVSRSTPVVITEHDGSTRGRS